MMPGTNRGRGERGLLNHGPGKGDADRTTDSKAFNQNFDEIDFDDITSGFETSSRGYRKVYGARATKPDRTPHIRIC